VGSPVHSSGVIKDYTDKCFIFHCSNCDLFGCDVANQNLSFSLKSTCQSVVQVKSFLVSYSRLATEQMASMVLSEENAKGFASARRKLGEELLQRPLSSLVPSARACQEARDGAWAIAESPLPLSDEVIALCSKLVAAESQPSQTPPRVARVFLVFSLRET